MQATHFLRINSKVLSSLMGGFALFCLYYAGKVIDPQAVLRLLLDTLFYGGSATAIVYFQGKYLDR